MRACIAHAGSRRHDGKCEATQPTITHRVFLAAAGGWGERESQLGGFVNKQASTKKGTASQRYEEVLYLILVPAPFYH